MSEHMIQTAILAEKNKCSDDLSEASKISLKLQGGIMSDIETEQFTKNKNYENAIKLRGFDEGAKNLNIKIKKIKNYKELLLSKII
jgi:predicted HD phosphohydrolase